MHRTTLVRQISRTASSAASTPLRGSSCSSSSSSSSSLLRQRVPSSPSSIRSLHTSRPAVAASWTTIRLPSRRLYSDAAEKPAGAVEVDATAAAKEGEAGTELDKAKAQIEAKDKEILDWKNKYLYNVADFRNLQERTKREQAAARDFAISKFARDLVESIDNLDRALETVPAEQLRDGANVDLRNLYDGLKMTERILLATLAKHGLERFDPAVNAERFDPNRHEAAWMNPVEGKEDGTVYATMQKGFSLNGRIIRAAKVGVVKNS